MISISSPAALASTEVAVLIFVVCFMQDYYRNAIHVIFLSLSHSLTRCFLCLFTFVTYGIAKTRGAA